MPTLDWLNRAEALIPEDKTPCRLLKPVSGYGDANTENLLIQDNNIKRNRLSLDDYDAHCLKVAIKKAPLWQS